MLSPRKAQGPAHGADRRDLENVLRSAAKFLRTHQPDLSRQLPRKKSATVLYQPEQRCS